jgi:DNA-binding protein H-NS
MRSRPTCPGCDSDDADFRRAMRGKRACPHCRLPPAVIAVVWYVRSHNVRKRRRTKDDVDQLLDRVAQLENENAELVADLAAATAERATAEQLQVDLSTARDQLAQLQTENARLLHELTTRSAPPPPEPTIVEVPTPAPGLVEQMHTLRQEMAAEMDTVVATAQKMRELLEQVGPELSPLRSGRTADPVTVPIASSCLATRSRSAPTTAPGL